MPIVRMPDGQDVDMPETPSPELKAKMQAKYPELFGKPEAAKPAAPQGKPDLMPEATRKFMDGKQPPETGAQAVLSSGTMGALMGAASPEIVSGLGMASLAIPGAGEVIAPVLMATGRAMRVGRAAEAVAGGLSGLGSELAGQGVEQAGGSPLAANTARVAGGFLTPGASQLAAGAPKMVEAMVSQIPGLKTAWHAVQALSQKVEEGGSAKVRSQLANLVGADGRTAPQLEVHAALQQGVAEDLKASEQAAAKMAADGHRKAAELTATNPEAAAKAVAEHAAEAKKIRDAALARAEKIDKLTEGKSKTAEGVLKLAEPELAKVGAPKELSDIGKDLRTKVSAEQNAAIAAREKQYGVMKKERDAEVEMKEMSGQRIEQLPGMQALQKELQAKLLSTEAARKAAGDLAPVSEKGVLKAYEDILSAVGRRRVVTGVNDEGNNTFKEFKISFNALDDVRRKLGKVGKGEAEGYDAIGKNIARDLYNKIKNVQEEFAGPVQKEMQDFYAGSTKEMSKFDTATGRKMTAVDRIDPEAFSKDPKSIPGAYFNSQQGVRDLKELTGDASLVEREAHNYAVQSVRGQDAKGVKAWVAKQSDWMREVPGLGEKLNKYAGSLEGIEKRAAETNRRVEALKGGKQKVMAEAATSGEALKAAGLKEAGERVGSRVEEGQKAVEAGEKAGAAHAAEVRKQVQGIAVNGFPGEDVRKLLTQGSREDLRTASRYLAGTPGGAKALEGSVRNVLASTSPGKLHEVWDSRLKVALEDGGVMPKAAVEKLDAQVQAIFATHTGKEARTGLMRLLNGALATAGSMGMASRQQR